jgi:bifunctional DNase/RNase
MTSKAPEDSAIEMYVGGLVLDPNTQAPVVILKDEEGKYILPIWIGIAEATSIASAIKQVAMARPLTHDLMHEIFLQTDVKVQRVFITELKESTYFAELTISRGDRVMLIDARPSDAIAIALRESAPIFVTKSVLEQSKNTLQIEQAEPMARPPESVIDEKDEASSAQSDSQSTDSAEASESEEIPTADQSDFKNIDKSQWEDLLEKLDPDDFKHKM